MKNILVLADYYLPGYKAGGPIRTISNMVDWLGDEYAFYILTRDRDLGDDKPYPRVPRGEWVQVGGARVRYLAPDELGWFKWARLLNSMNYDLLYMNSFFSTLSVYTLTARKLGRLPDKPILLAPRGEFYPGALALKPLKKRAYMNLTRQFNLLEGVDWQASNTEEADTIREAMPDEGGQIYTAQNLNRRTLPDLEPRLIPKQDSARLIFLSRISRKKNLDYAIRALMRVQGDVTFDIYGPIEDDRYWRECEKLIEGLPANIKVMYKGPVPGEQITTTFSEYHGFLFPTAGENFGHVIWEALFAGCLPLISDRTPWKNLGEHDIGWMVPLERETWYQAAISELISMPAEAHYERAQAAHAYACDHMQDDTVLDANQHMLARVLGEGKAGG